MSTICPSECNVLILGAGVAGSAAAYHLSCAGVTNICVLDSGSPGLGSATGTPLVPHAVIRSGDDDEMFDVSFSNAKSSGTAVFQDGVTGTIKMIVNVFPCSCKEFIGNHGVQDARSYLKLARKGLELEKKLAKQVLPDPAKQLTELGSLYVCLEEDAAAFYEEFTQLVSLGADDIELWDREKVQKAAGPGFHGGIFFPHDAVIDSTAYAQGLLRKAAESGNVTVFEKSAPAASVETIYSLEGPRESFAKTTLLGGHVIRSAHVVVATGGLFMEKNLAGVLTPCWSYLVSIPEPAAAAAGPTGSTSASASSGSAPSLPPPPPPNFRLQSPNSMNFFSWKFTHDWCLTNGHLRCSGEDHFSALKPPRSVERCRALTDWTVEKLPYLKPEDGSAVPYASRYGVYSETPDHAPLVGTPHPESRVCYLLGCNAWGQASLSFASSMVPKLLGYTAMDPESRDLLRCMHIRRFALLDAVLGHPK